MGLALATGAVVGDRRAEKAISYIRAYDALMDRFSEVAVRCASFMIEALNKASADNMGDGSTVFVKNAQALQLGKVVTVVGIFSIFEARLQDGLKCSDGLAELRKILLGANEQELASRFEQFAAAVNVLKHGRGRSYDLLLSMRDTLPFVLKAPDQHFFFEGEVSEVHTLVLVDDAFVHSCVVLVQDLIDAVQSAKPDVYFD